MFERHQYDNIGQIPRRIRHWKVETLPSTTTSNSSSTDDQKGTRTGTMKLIIDTSCFSEMYTAFHEQKQRQKLQKKLQSVPFFSSHYSFSPFAHKKAR
jgi:hypothetical protein